MFMEVKGYEAMETENQKIPFEQGLNDREKRLLALYQSLAFSQNPVCRKCRKENNALKRPISAWLVGNQFYQHKIRVLFVGKNARGEPGKVCRDFLAAFHVSRNQLWQKSWPYWNYTRAIANTLYGKDDIENIAFTNIVKCNDSDKQDTTSKTAKKFCVCELGVIGKEIEIIEPTHIIFYTSSKYDDCIPCVFEKFTETNNKTIAIGKKKMPWMEAIGERKGNRFRILRIGHPERMKKTDYVAVVSAWILQSAESLE